MQRMGVVVVVAALLMLGLYFMANKPVPAPSSAPRAPITAPAAAPAPAQPVAPSQPSAPVANVQQPQPQAVAQAYDVGKLRHRYVTAGRVKLDLGLLASFPAFSTVNKIPMADLLSGRVAADKIVIPPFFPLTYEIISKCNNYPMILEAGRMFKKWHRTTNIFLSHEQEKQETVASLGARLQNEKCIKEVTANASTPETANRPPTDQAQARIIQDAVQKAVSRRQTPHFVFIGSRDAIITADQTLTDSDEDSPKTKDSPGVFALNGKVVPVMRRAVVVKEPKNRVMTSARISMAMARAVFIKANVIIIDHPNFDPKDHESAMQNAASQGVVVVTNMPVPKPEPTFAKAAAKRLEERGRRRNAREAQREQSSDGSAKRADDDDDDGGGRRGGGGRGGGRHRGRGGGGGGGGDRAKAGGGEAGGGGAQQRGNRQNRGGNGGQ